MFSYFTKVTNNKPSGTISLQELHKLLIHPGTGPFATSAKIVERLRATDNEQEQKRLKAELPAIMPGGTVDTKASAATTEERNLQYSGFLQIDIDAQDNPGMNDPAAVRDKLAEIPYVALAAISARGRGVWGLIALQEPEKFEQYADQVRYMFKKARVTLDKSKGKNPFELRYFAPDPGAILKTDHTPLPLVPPTKSRELQHLHGAPVNYSQSVEEAEQWVKSYKGYEFIDGQKHYFLYWLTYSLTWRGYPEAEVRSIIYENYLPKKDIHSNCITDGLADARRIMEQLHETGATTSTRPPRCSPEVDFGEQEPALSNTVPLSFTITFDAGALTPETFMNAIREKYNELNNMHQNL